jgi:hypothetical protein
MLSWVLKKAYFKIKQPSEDDLMNLEWFELTSQHPDLADRIRQEHSAAKETDIPKDWPGCQKKWLTRRSSKEQPIST